MKVYISGPMTGYDDYNYPAFHRAAQECRDRGMEVESPAEYFEGKQDLPRQQYLAYDMQVIPTCDAVLMLEGWRNSAGSRLEYMLAVELGLTILGDDGDPVEYEASRIVRNGERQKNYGHPNQDFTRTAGMWTAYLSHKLAPGEVITMEDMALMMGQLKMSRLASTPGHHDSVVDLIGYSICYDRLGETQ